MGCLFKFQIPGPIQVERPRITGAQPATIFSKLPGGSPCMVTNAAQSVVHSLTVSESPLLIQTL